LLTPRPSANQRNLQRYATRPCPYRPISRIAQHEGPTGDAAYDAGPLRQSIAAKGAVGVIPTNPTRTRRHPLNNHLYGQCHLIDCCFSKLKQSRLVTTRYEKTARKYLSVVTLAANILWLR